MSQTERTRPTSDSPSRADREAAEVALLVIRRAIRRLDILEWVIFLVGAVLAGLGGALIARVLAPMVGWGFRSTWIGASFLLFVIPGMAAIIRIRRDARAYAARAEGKRMRDDG